ncbi:SDR family NAD(P)-dependent oxidoreductase [Erwinia billingiae]|uniref:SDR family NAD(P)-dependent oxidoreductase n=1 Tax=Erwinia billingiae TaxID=182337 RepID=UPI0032094300
MKSRITTPFGFTSTADDVLRDVDLSGQRAIVTGGSSGIGIDTARVLAKAGAEVTIAVRNLEAGNKVATELNAAGGHQRVQAKLLDLADQTSVSAFVNAWNGPLHILVNNGGVMAIPEKTLTVEGWEMQLATNYIGHFALTLGLHGALAAAGHASGARVVVVSSSGNLLAPVFFGDMNFNFLGYDPLLAYGQSKTACALMAVEATRRWEADGIFVNALNPGAIATNLQKHTGGLKTPPERRKNTAQGAATSVLLAASPQLASIGGRYFEDCNEAPVVLERPGDYRGVATYAVDPVLAERLWDDTLKMITQ